MAFYRDGRDRDYPPSPRRSAPEVATEVLVRERERSVSRERTPAFLRERPRREAGPMVLARREVETVSRQRPRSPSPVYVERVERVVRRSPSPPPARYRERVVEVDRGRRRSPSRGREVSVERVRIRRDSSSSISSSPSPPPRRVIRRPRSVSPEWKGHEHIRTRIVKRERSPSPAPPPPPPEPQVVRGPTIEREVITHYTDVDHGVVVARQPSPPPRPKSRSKHRDTEIDIYTSKNETEVDIHRQSHSRSHGRSRSRARSRSRVRHIEDDSLVIVDRSRLMVDHHGHSRSRSHSRTHRRAHSAAPLPTHVRDEADEIASRIDSRGRMGEAWGGATRDWTIVDVPPGTERVRMDGVGGGSAEVNWSRYSGVRRTQFIPERDGALVRALPPPATAPPRQSGDRLSVHVHDHDRDIDIVRNSDRRVAVMPPQPRPSEMWTEITKDLVSREAIRKLGYNYEETEWFYYIMDYLRYEDVQQLIQMSDDIRRARRLKGRQRLRDAELDVHVHAHKHRHAHSPYRQFIHEDDRYVERDVVVDRTRRYY